ncbi:MAG: transglutaminase family protein [Chthonomonadales bacterium]
MRLKLTHLTHYFYPGMVIEGQNEVRLKPIEDAWQQVVSYRLDVQPDVKSFLYNESGGPVEHFSMVAPHNELKIESHAVVDSLLINPFQEMNLLVDDMDIYGNRDFQDNYAEFLTPTDLVPLMSETADIAAEVRSQTDSCAASYIIALNTRICRLIEYSPGATHVHSTLPEVLADPRGVCQDYAHVMLAACRSQNIPARYVSGYVYSPPGDNSMHAEQSTHAWVECLLPDGRWVGFDPTNNLVVNDAYVRLHTGRDYLDAAPVRGIYRGPRANRLLVSVKLERLDDEDQPVTSPELTSSHQ